MKYILTIILATALSSQAPACTKSDSNAISKVKRMFQIDGDPVDWVSVKTRTNSESNEKTIQLNRSFPVTVFATSRISSSKIEFKREIYDLSGAKICFKDKKILVTHEFGELIVGRRGRKVNDSEISLRQNGGLFKLRLRPKKLLGNKRSITL